MSLSKICVALSFFLLSIVGAFAQKGYKISGNIKGFTSGDALLAYHYGKKQYIKDTVQIDNKGNFTFQGDEKLPGGIYLVVDPRKKWFEVLIGDDQDFSFTTDTSAYIEDMKFKGSEENEKFYKYLVFISDKRKVVDPLRDSLKTLKKGSDEYKKLEDQITSIDNEVKNYQNDVIKKNPNLFVGKLLKAQQDIEIPDPPVKEDGSIDSSFQWKYYKEHYFDNIDFSDARILRTPIYEDKIDYYVDKLTVQHPDSLMLSVDYLCDKAKANDEVFKFTVISLINKYATSKIMGFDAVYVHMAKKYYCSGQAKWSDPDQLEKICDNAKKLEPTLIGQTAPDITLQKLDTKDLFNESVTLSDVKAKYTFLYFWDPTCGHCKKFTPKLYDWYQANKDKYDIKTYAVCTIVKQEDIDAYLKDHTFDWINVWDPFNKSGFRDKYDIRSTPVFFILDENKKIIAKRVNIEDVEGILDRNSKKQAQVFKKMHEDQ